MKIQGFLKIFKKMFDLHKFVFLALTFQNFLACCESSILISNTLNTIPGKTMAIS